MFLSNAILNSDLGCLRTSENTEIRWYRLGLVLTEIFNCLAKFTTHE